MDTYFDVINFIKKDIFDVNGIRVSDLNLIRSKNGVYVYKSSYDGVPAVIKYFEKDKDRREIKNYRVLNENKIPTLNIFTFGQSSIVMEDVNLSVDWRLGTEDDLQDIKVINNLANWYFDFHEKGIDVPELATLYCEYDIITESNIEEIIVKFNLKYFIMEIIYLW